MRGREVLRETREEVAKSGDVWRESRLVFFERSGGGGRRNAFLLLFLACKSRISVLRSEKHPVKLIFSAQNAISGENFSQGEEKNTPKKVVFAPKVAGSGEKGRFWGGNHREGVKRKNGLNYRFCNAMK